MKSKLTLTFGIFLSSMVFAAAPTTINKDKSILPDNNYRAVCDSKLKKHKNYTRYSIEAKERFIQSCISYQSKFDSTKKTAEETCKKQPGKQQETCVNKFIINEKTNITENQKSETKPNKDKVATTTNKPKEVIFSTSKKSSQKDVQDTVKKCQQIVNSPLSLKKMTKQEKAHGIISCFEKAQEENSKKFPAKPSSRVKKVLPAKTIKPLKHLPPTQIKK